MQSIVLKEPGQLQLFNAPPPLPPDRDEVQVRVRQVGICGTDLHAFAGKQPFLTYPRILGHELAVEVVEIGFSERQHPLRIGDRCCVRPYLNCGICGACQRGNDNCCEQLQVLGVHCDGGMREIINLPLDKLHVAPSLSNTELALVEMLSIGAHAVNRAHITPDELVLVIGLGPIGSGVCQFGKEAGAQVIGMDVNDNRLAFAEQYLNVDYLIDAKQNITEQLRSIIRHDLPTVVFDATGNKQSMMSAFQYTAHGGQLIFVGLFQGDISFYDPEFHRRELSLLASRNATAADFTRVINTLETKQKNFTPWITHQVTPDEIVSAFPNWLEPESGVVKAMLTF